MTALPLHVRLSFHSFSKVMTIAAALAYGLIGLGAAVRATGASTACPDWPLCYSQAVPAFDLPIFLQWSHRFLALVLISLLVVAAARVIRSQPLRAALGKPFAAAFGLVGSEVALGGFNVMKGFPPLAVTAHLAIALLVLSLFVWMAVHAGALAQRPPNVRPLRPVPAAVTVGIVVAAAGAFAEAVVGALISGRGAGLACPDFPTCYGHWLPSFSFAPLLQMVHRGAAFLLLAGLVGLIAISSRAALPPVTRLSLRLTPMIALLQIFTGVASVLLSLPAWLSVVHLTLAVALYILLLLAAVALSHSPKRANRSITLPMRGDWRMKDQPV